ncbi:hypothetical protein M2352_001799 [Azospirillum fermentarium]|uniref:hypothetical protein n=1 Tax=Azospirillum fermentarium TaxID=1233114 RepID=UPI002226464A|nr:hypothetical protein [Azospirillum fermentarium]MCW2246208.1 hypothetical protein [Azospirillum fermentarium]
MAPRFRLTWPGSSPRIVSLCSGDAMPTETDALDRALAQSGADVTVVRPGTPTISVSCKAKVFGLTAQTIRAGSSSSQGNYRAILSPTPFLTAGFPLPIRTTDKINWNGSQRTITFAWPIPIGTTAVRLEIDFTG